MINEMNNIYFFFTTFLINILYLLLMESIYQPFSYIGLVSEKRPGTHAEKYLSLCLEP